jgi:menaquinone-dependent protoporphyrinogen oxidase
MRVLVTYGSARGGTEGVARSVACALRSAGHSTAVLPCAEASPILGAFDAVLVGGTLCDGRWPLGLRWFLWRRAADLRRLAVWFFSCGSPEGPAAGRAPAVTAWAQAQMFRVGARGHATFGEQHLEEQVLGWAREVAASLDGAPRRARAVGE